MGKKKIEPLLTPLEIHNNLFACINCQFEKNCNNKLPFPLELCECCSDYKKTVKNS